MSSSSGWFVAVVMVVSLVGAERLLVTGSEFMIAGLEKEWWDDDRARAQGGTTTSTVPQPSVAATRCCTSQHRTMGLPWEFNTRHSVSHVPTYRE